MRYPALRFIIGVTYVLAAIVALVVFLFLFRSQGIFLALVAALLSPVFIVAGARACGY